MKCRKFRTNIINFAKKKEPYGCSIVVCYFNSYIESNLTYIQLKLRNQIKTKFTF